MNRPRLCHSERNLFGPSLTIAALRDDVFLSIERSRVAQRRASLEGIDSDRPRRRLAGTRRASGGRGQDHDRNGNDTAVMPRRGNVSALLTSAALSKA
jgi:hypothetical protein